MRNEIFTRTQEDCIAEFCLLFSVWYLFQSVFSYTVPGFGLFVWVFFLAM